MNFRAVPQSSAVSEQYILLEISRIFKSFKVITVQFQSNFSAIHPCEL